MWRAGLPVLLAVSGVMPAVPALAASPVIAQQALSPADMRQIAREAYVYGFPMVDNYRIQYA
jgi:hypothetical protein